MALTRTYSKNIKEMLDAIAVCLKSERHLPALVLMYSLIDSLSWAESGQSSADTRSRFEGWVAKWVLPNLPRTIPQVTATDLYAARCALLHTGTGTSELVRSKRAKRLMYAWGKGKTEILERAIVVTGSSNEHAAIHCDKLFLAIRRGLRSFVASADNDPQLKTRLRDAASAQYENVLTA